MPINGPSILYVGNSAYDLSKVIGWAPDAVNPAVTRLRFAGTEGLISVPITAADFADVYQGGTSVLLLDQVTAVAVGDPQQVSGAARTFMAVITGTGAVSATVLVEVSNNGVNWLTQSTLGLSGTNSDVKGTAVEANWPFVRGSVTVITGTGAAVDLTLSLSR